MANMIEFDYMNRDIPTAHVKVNVQTGEVFQTVYSDFPLDKALFEVSMQGVDEFFRRRCFPENRVDKNELLDCLGLLSYSPIEICKKTHGVMGSDHRWIRFRGENIKYWDISCHNPDNVINFEDV